MSDDNCLDAASADGPVKLVRCHGMGGNQAWNYNEDVSNQQLNPIAIWKFCTCNALTLFCAFQDKTLRHMNTNRCLATQKDDPSNPQLEECSSAKNQRWTMGQKFKWQARNENGEDEDEI